MPCSAGPRLLFLTLHDSQFAEPTDFRDVTWPFLRDVAQAADGACDAIRERGRLLAEVHANAVRAKFGFLRGIQNILSDAG